MPGNVDDVLTVRDEISHPRFDGRCGRKPPAKAANRGGRFHAHREHGELFVTSHNHTHAGTTGDSGKLNSQSITSCGTSSVCHAWPYW